MSWNEHHTESERLASAAELAARQGHAKRAAELYLESAEKERLALAAIDPKKTRTLGVTAVSAISLYYKAGEHKAAMDFGREWLANGNLPPFAGRQVQEVLDLLDIGSPPSVRRIAVDSRAPSNLKSNIRGQSVARSRGAAKKERTGQAITRAAGIPTKVQSTDKK